MKNFRLPFFIAFINIALSGIGQCSFTGLNSNYCTNSPTSALTPSVTGGTFSGNGVVGSVFSPSLAGPGTQTITYAMCQTSYAITQGTFAPLTTSGTGISLGDDAESSSLPIGFNFQFFCTTYSNFYISSNGFIEFALTGNGCCAGQSLPNSSTPNNLIAYAWTDLYPPSGGTITYTTIGTSPNRTLVVSFNGIYHYNSGSFCCPITSQIQLRESSNIIEIHTTTKPLCTNYTSYPTTMGIENSGGSIGYPVSGRNAATSWTATNECYRWTPGVTCSSSQTTIVSPSTITVVGSNSICSGTSTSLTATNNNTYTWTTSSGTLSNSAQIVQTPTSNITYSVQGTNSFGCIANSAITVTVDNTPSVTAVSSATGNGICPGRTVTLSGNGATTYSWSGGITNGVPFTIGSASNFTVTGTNACGSATAAVSISIHPTPTVGAVASQPTICSNNTATLTGTGAVSYTWFATGVNVTNGQAFFPPFTETYTVVGSNAQTCTNSAVTSITVVTTPLQPPVSTPTLICIGSSATLSATGATNYSWMPGSNLTTSAIVVSPNATTTYTITKWNANCIDIKTITLFVNQLPFVFGVAQPTVICANDAATLSVGGGVSYTWSPGNLPSGSGAANIVVNPSVPTIYTVAASDGTCINTTTVALAVNPLPTINVAFTSSVICLNQCSTLSLSGANSYTWSSNPPSTVTGTLAVVCPTSPINYSVSGTNTFGCISSKQQVIIVNPLPVITTSVSKPLVCSGFSSAVSATGTPGPVTYNWSTGSNLFNTIVNPINTSVYTVTVTINQTGCQSTKDATVSVYIPTFAVTPATAVCFGGSINICASGASSYTWATNPVVNFPCTLVSPSVATVYTVAATSFSSNVSCVTSTTIPVTIYSQPTVTAVPDRTVICKKESVNLMAGGAVTYTWSNNFQGGTITVSPIVQTSYTVYGTDQFGCMDTNFVVVKVSTCPGFKENSAGSSLSIYPNPNTGQFTISSDRVLSLRLFNELGQTIRTFELSGSNKFEVSVAELPNGVYFLTGGENNPDIQQKIIVAK